MKNIPIGEVLKEYGYITDDHIKQALDYQKTDAGKGKRLGALLQELGFVTERQVLESLGRKLELPMINFDDYVTDFEAAEKIPKPLAVKYNVLPLSQRDNKFQLAMSDPLNFYAQEDIRQIVNMPLEIYLAETALQIAYQLQDQVEVLRVFSASLEGKETQQAKPIIAF